MTAVDEVNSSLASKCMDFCQALASQGQAFNFSIVIGPNFSFSLDTRSKVMQESVTKKRSSPSTLHRNAKRREEFVKKKQNSSVRTYHCLKMIQQLPILCHVTNVTLLLKPEMVWKFTKANHIRKPLNLQRSCAKHHLLDPLSLCPQSGKAAE